MFVRVLFNFLPFPLPSPSNDSKPVIVFPLHTGARQIHLRPFFNISSSGSHDMADISKEGRGSGGLPSFPQSPLLQWMKTVRRLRVIISSGTFTFNNVSIRDVWLIFVTIVIPILLLTCEPPPLLHPSEPSNFRNCGGVVCCQAGVSFFCCVCH